MLKVKFHKRIIILSILFFSLIKLEVAISQSRSLGLPFSYHIDPSEYNAGMQNFAIEQDARGFMYFANNFGVLQFDGAQWTNFPVLNGSKVRDIAIADSGKIYAAAQGEFGYFVPDKTNTLAYQSLSKDLPKEHKNISEIWKVYKGTNEVYFCSFDKVFIYFEDQLVDVVSIPFSESFFFINNRLYTQASTGEFQVLFNGAFSPIEGLVLNSSEAIVSIIKNSEGSLLFTTNQGKLVNSSGVIQFDINDKEHEFSEKISLTYGLRLRNGNIALGTEKNGLIVVSEEGSIITHLTKNIGLPSRDVAIMQEDFDGNLWVARSNGISVVELGLPFSYISEELNLPGSGYDAYTDSEKLYLATNYGLYTSSLDGSSLDFELTPNTEGQAYSISEIDNKLFLGHHTGSYYLKNGRAELISDDNGMWKVIKDPVLSNKAIAGTYTGLDVLEIKSNSVKKIKRIPGLIESSRVMEFDDYGNLWMTHGYKGVFKISLTPSLDSIQELKFYGSENGLPSKEHVNVYKINNNLLYTSIDGIYKYSRKTDQFYKDTLEFNLEGLNQPIDVLVEASNKNIYFIARNSMGLLRKGTGENYEVKSDIFNKIFEQLNDDLINVSIINSNNILFGAKEGFVVYNPVSAGLRKSEHKAYIRLVKSGTSDEVFFSGGFEMGNSEELSLEFDQNYLSFSFSSNFLNDYQETEYSYYLEGFDETWSGWSKSNSVNFTNLFEGEYQFHVKARNIYNEESKEARYTFFILPPWYRTGIAYTGYGLAIFGTLLFSFVLIDRKYSKSQKQFEIEKQQEVDAIGTQLETLTQTTAEEISRLNAEKLEAEVERKNTELAASTMNLINKNKFISHIKDNLNSITKKSKSAEVKKELTSTMKEIDKNISHDDDWKQFTFHFNNVHGDFTTRLTNEFKNLSGQDIRLCSYLRLNLSTKEIAELLNISVRGVEISRYRLRKKLQLDRSQNLAEFILNY